VGADLLSTPPLFAEGRCFRQTVTARAATQSGFGTAPEQGGDDQSWIGGSGGGFFAGAATAAGGGADAGTAGGEGAAAGRAGAVAAPPGGGPDLIGGASAGLSLRNGLVSWVATSGARDFGNGGGGGGSDGWPPGAGRWECASGAAAWGGD
jgi:hypothetical protein